VKFRNQMKFRTHSPLAVRSFTLAAMLFALCASATVSAKAQISLSSAVDLALRGNPKVLAAQSDVAKAHAAVDAARDAYIPILSTSAGVGESKGVPLGVPVVFSMSSNSLLFNFSQHDNVRAAEAALHAANLTLKDVRDQVAEDVVVTYLQLDNTQKRQAVMAEELTYANRLVAIVQDRLDAGEDTRIELLRSRRTAKQIELQQLQLADEATTLSDHLDRLIGLPGNHLKTVADSIPALPAIQTLQPLTLQPGKSDSYGIEAAFANAHSKQELAFGEARYSFRPQISLGISYDYISTAFTEYAKYYPGFTTQNPNAFNIGIQVQIPLLDRRHDATARQDAADAAHAYYDALDQRNLFREGRLKLQRSALELQARAELAALDRDLAQEDINTILIQLSGPGDAGRPMLTPKDEQNARLQERSRTLDLLNTQSSLTQAQVNLMRQTGQLDSWLHSLATMPERVPAKP
jgi:outer membrane protein TolC